MHYVIIICGQRLVTVCAFRLIARRTVKGSAPPKKTELPGGRKLKAHFQVSKKTAYLASHLHYYVFSLSPLSVPLPSERIFEDHENLVENLLNWTRDSHNKLMFIERIEKYALFKNPQVTVHYTSTHTHSHTLTQTHRHTDTHTHIQESEGRSCSQCPL